MKLAAIFTAIGVLLLVAGVLLGLFVNKPMLTHGTVVLAAIFLIASNLTV